MNAIGASVLTLLVLVVFLAPRRWALLGMMAGVLYLTQGQAIDVLGLHLYPVRILELAGFIRVMARREFSFSRMNGIDKALILAYGYTAIVFLLRTAMGGGTSSDIGQVSTMDKVGILVDAGLCYFAFRGLVGTVGEFVWFLRSFVVLLVPYVVLLSIERLTGQNPFAIVGGLAQTWVGGDRIRCFGSFRHPSLLGTFGASLLPLYIGLAFSKNNRFPALAGIGLCLAIVFLSNSGGPASVAAVGVVAWLLWPLRKKMFVVRRAIFGALILLALFMKAPLWYLPDKMSLIVGGDGWHRSFLMNQAFTNIHKWWLAGMPLDQTREWFPYLVMGAVDVTNFYLALGIDAGVLAIVLFVLLLVRAFRSLGQAQAAVRRSSRRAGETELVLWGLGAALAGHAFNFFAITYFDQIYVVWFMQLAAISTISQVCMQGRVKSAPTSISNNGVIHSAMRARENLVVEARVSCEDYASRFADWSDFGRAPAAGRK